MSNNSQVGGPGNTDGQQAKYVGHAIGGKDTSTGLFHIISVDSNGVVQTAGGGGGTVTADQGAPNNIGQAWPVEISDGVVVLGTPTNPLRTDPTGTTIQPVTVATSLPAGTAVIGHVINDASSAVIGHVIADSGSTTAVTSLPAIPTGSNVIGKVSIDQTTPGTTNLVSIGTNGTVTLAAGAAVIGHVINDASSAVIGHVIADSGSTTAVTGTVTVAQATGTNLHVVLDTTSTTAVTQATGTNLHCVCDTGSTTVVTGTVTIAGNKTNNNAVPGATNVGTLPAVATTAAPSYTTTDQVALSTDLAGNLRAQLVSVAGTTLGVPTNFGTTPGAVIAESANASLFIGTVAAIANTGTATTGTLRVVLATDQPQLTNKLLVTPDANSGVNLQSVGGNSTNVGNGTSGTGTLRVAIVSDQTQLTNSLKVVQTPTTAGSTTKFTLSIGNTATAIKASAGQLLLLDIFNANTAFVYVQLFDTAAGSVTPGTTAPLMSFGVPAGGGKVIALDSGIGSFATAITVCCTTTRTGGTNTGLPVDLNGCYV